MGWRGGSQPQGLCMALCTTTVLEGTVCWRRSRQVRWDGTGADSCFPFPVSPFLVAPGGACCRLLGTLFHAVCVFCELGRVAIPVRAACPLSVCALALPRCARSPPFST